MENISKATIVIPIAVLVLAVFMRLTGSYSNAERLIPSPTLIPTQQIPQNPFSSFSFGNSSSSAKLDLDGPLVCDYSSKDLAVKAQIKDKNVYAEINETGKVNNMLLNGDCFYQWTNTEALGNKMCGISNYISIAESLPFLNFLNVETVFSFIKQIQPSITVTDQQAKDITQTCIEEEVNDTAFRIPTNITFQENSQSSTSLEDLQQ